MEIDAGAVLPPPNLRLFCELVQARPGEIRVVATGWTKYVLLTPTSAFLLPRFPEHVEPLAFETDVVETLTRFELPFVPKLIGRHDIPDIWPFRFIEVERMAGEPITEDDSEPQDSTVVALMSSLGEALGSLHSLPTITLPEPLGKERLLHHIVDDQFAARAAGRVSSTMFLPPNTAQRWADAFAPLTRLEDVFTHGELGDSQLLHSDGTLTAILDWDTAGVGPPLGLLHDLVTGWVRRPGWPVGS